MSKPQLPGADVFITASTFGSFNRQCPFGQSQTNETLYSKGIFFLHTATSLNTSGSISSVFMEKAFSLMWNHYRLLSAFDKQINVRVQWVTLKRLSYTAGFGFLRHSYSVINSCHNKTPYRAKERNPFPGFYHMYWISANETYSS